MAVRAIGFACAKMELAWVVLEGTLDSFVLTAHLKASAPKNRSRAEELAWLRAEVLTAARDAAIQRASYRDVEHMARGGSTAPRFESQGVLQEAWYSARPDVPLVPLLAAGMKAALKFKGAVGDLPDHFIVGSPLHDLPKAYKDAALVALCGLVG